MKKLSTVSLALAALFATGSASAGDMFINLAAHEASSGVGLNYYDTKSVIGPGPFPGVRPFDANSTTAIFNEFGFSQMLATSIYDFSDGSVFGSFYDTNIPSELAFAGVPTSGTPLSGSGTVNLVLPNCLAGQCDIDALSPLVPPLDTDSEGFLQTWDLQVSYHFDGTLTATGPVYTGGTFKVFFNDRTAANADFLAFEGVLTGSTVDLTNLSLFFDITAAAVGFLWIDNGSGTFIDASTQAGTANPPKLSLDTNVFPPIPTANQLLLVVDGGGNPNVIRQSRLDGSITASIPEPASVALLGIGLLGLGFSRRRKA